MKGGRHITGFYIETLILIVVFISIILVISNVFGLARLRNAHAQELSSAVSLAQNTAEAVSLSKDVQGLADLLAEGGAAPENAASETAGGQNTAPAVSAEADGSGVTARYNDRLEPDPAGDYKVRISWEPAGSLVKSHIAVCFRDQKEPVYELDTAVYVKEAGR